MTRALVVCFRRRAAESEAKGFEAASAAIVQRARALGGRMVAWHASGFAVSLVGVPIDDAIELVTPAPPAFSIGIAEGALELWIDLGAQAALASGPALERAEKLAQLARAGEVLLDPRLDAVKNERVLTRGARLGMLDNIRVRGLRLDSARPLRSDAASNLARLVTPPRVGQALALEITTGSISLIQGDHGSGGTRALADVAPHAVLRLTPVLGEPLGALRGALEREQSAMAALDPGDAASIESLVAGEGLDAESTVAALSAWLDQHGPGAVIAIDDVEYVDSDSLEVVAELLVRGRAACVVRTFDALPSAFAALEIAGTVTLEPLSAGAATELTRAFVAGALAERAAARWARRGGYLPLGIRDALSEALESGELVVEGDAIIARARLAGRGPTEPLEHWVIRRARFLPASARHVLDAIAVLGAALSSEELLSIVGGERAVLEHELALLEQSGWIGRDGERLSLSSATHALALERALEDSTRAKIHSSACRVLSSSPRPTAGVAAAVHALLAGNLDGSLPLARRGAAACRAAGMTATAHALVRFTESGDPGKFAERGLLGGASTSRAGLQRSDVPPAKSLVSRAPASRRRRAEPAVRESRQPAHITLVGPVDGEPELAARLTRAFQQSDSLALNALIAELRADQARSLIATRVEAMIHVFRGELSEALRLSRQAKHDAIMHGASERSRAALAHAIALAAAGRKSDALLEALDGLARAREASDAHGEQACARFLGKLSKAGGQPEAAATWFALAKA